MITQSRGNYNDHFRARMAQRHADFFYITPKWLSLSPDSVWTIGKCHCYSFQYFTSPGVFAKQNTALVTSNTDRVALSFLHFTTALTLNQLAQDIYILKFSYGNNIAYDRIHHSVVVLPVMMVFSIS
jgi:hypothetical protein